MLYAGPCTRAPDLRRLDQPSTSVRLLATSGHLLIAAHSVFLSTARLHCCMLMMIQACVLIMCVPTNELHRIVRSKRRVHNRDVLLHTSRYRIGILRSTKNNSHVVPLTAPVVLSEWPVKSVRIRCWRGAQQGASYRHGIGMYCCTRAHATRYGASK